MSNEPLDRYTLGRVAARKAWEAFGGEGLAPASFHRAVEMVIEETYQNVDKMIEKTIRQRLEALYNNE